MGIIERAKEYLEVVKIHLSNQHLTDDVSYYAFLVSLLPIPGVQQVGQVVDRIFTNMSLKTVLDSIWDEINLTNKNISSIQNEVERLQEIAGTVKYNKNIDEKIAQIITLLLSDLENSTEWVLKTENWSYQSVLNSIVETDFAQIVSRNNSVNIVENSEIRANRTHLHASDHSRNFFDKTKFINNHGSIGMDGISTNGNLFVQGNSIGFGEGSSIIFGGNPNLKRGYCPFCQSPIEIDIRQLVGYTQLQCPNCKKIMPFDIAPNI